MTGHWTFLLNKDSHFIDPGVVFSTSGKISAVVVFWTSRAFGSATSGPTSDPEDSDPVLSFAAGVGFVTSERKNLKTKFKKFFKVFHAKSETNLKKKIKTKKLK